MISVWPGLGDIIFATPAIRLLRRRLPDAFIAVASLAGGAGEELLETNPYLDEVYWVDEGLFSLGGVRRAVDWARRRRFDIGIELSQPVQWFFEMAGITARYRFGKRGLWWLAPYRDAGGRDLHASEHFTRAVEDAVGPLERDGRGFDLFVTGDDERRAESLLSGIAGDRFVAIHPGARCNRNKRWDLARFAELARRLERDRGCVFAVIGGPDDVPLAEEIKREVGGEVLVAAGKATLRETAALIGRAALYVGNDSGPLHIAGCMGTPIVGIFASTSPDNFGPVTDNANVVSPGDSCAPCLYFPGYNWLYWGLRLRYYNRCKAMEGLGVEPVYEACLELLDR